MKITSITIDAIRQNRSVNVIKMLDLDETGGIPYKYRYEVDAAVFFSNGASLKGTFAFDERHGIRGFASAEAAIRALCGEAE